MFISYGRVSLTNISVGAMLVINLSLIYLHIQNNGEAISVCMFLCLFVSLKASSQQLQMLE